MNVGRSIDVPIRRCADGELDFAHYRRRARRLRGRWMRAWLGRLVRRVARAWRRRAVEAELDALEPRMMRDIGIARSDVPSIASGSYFRDRSRLPRRTAVQPAAASAQDDQRVGGDRALRARDQRIDVQLRQPAAQRPGEP